jgi:small GTP-binding protein
LLISDLSDEFDRIKAQMERMYKEFMDTFGTFIDGEITKDDLVIFTPVVEKVHKNLKPKISLVGFSGVGKTTITRLITAQDIPTEHVPTITGDIGTIKIGKLHFSLWDFAGQEQFSFLWNKFIQGSDGVLLITDSSLENIEKSKYFVDLIRAETPYAHTAIIGNKQDLPEAMPPDDIERHLTLKVYPMVATDKNNRQKMINIIANILDIATEDSEFFKPIAERDAMIKEAEVAINCGDREKALHLYETLVQKCLELGDDKLSQQFNLKAQALKKGGGADSSVLAPLPVQPAIPAAPQPTVPKPPAEKAEELIKEYKVKIASVAQKMADLELQNITGDLSDADFKEKIGRLEQLKVKMEQQMKELQ